MYIQQSTRTLRYSLSYNHLQWQPRVVLSLPHVIEIVNKMLKNATVIMDQMRIIFG